MATSGTVSQTVFNTRRVIDRAFGRCKVRPQEITAEKIEIAKDNLFLLLSNLVNRGILLWALEKSILPLYQGQAEIELPLGTVDLQSYNHRTLTRLSGTYATSAGGTVANGFDDDFDTSVTQISTNGNVQVDFGSGSETQVTTVGLLANATASYNLVIERSDDATTWVEVAATGAVSYTAGVWYWYDLDGAIAARYWRVRETGGGTINFREIFFGNSPSEIPLARLNQDDYTNLPNKTFSGRPLQFWLDRRRGASTSLPVMYTWPVCDLASRYDQFVVWRQRYIQDVGTLAQEIEVPQRWYRSVVAQLAADLAEELPEVNVELATRLEAKAERTWFEAQNEERDNSPITITPAINVYTK